MMDFLLWVNAKKYSTESLLMKKRHNKGHLHVLIIAISLLTLSACTSTATQTKILPSPQVFTTANSKSTETLITLSPSNTDAVLPNETLTPNASPSPLNTSQIQQPTKIAVTLEAFNVEVFNPGTLWEGVEPETYFSDACHYLAQKWDPEKSPPGTIVAPIMFHSIKETGRVITDTTSITEENFLLIMAHAEELGFETITSEELIAFLKENARIPARSMIMILDDRRPGVTERFLPYLDSNDWTLTLGWIIEDQREYLWDWLEDIYTSSGRLDVQSHGYWHRYIVEETTDEIIQEELYDPIPIIEEHIGIRPIIFIWPGGNFTAKSVQTAHEAGYELAFTSYAHGPIMFNWIPQSEQERLVGDPLMTLPRFWSTTMWNALDETIQIAEAAAQYALQQYPIEADWYQRNCGGELPPPPEVETPTSQ